MREVNTDINIFAAGVCSYSLMLDLHAGHYGFAVISALCVLANVEVVVLARKRGQRIRPSLE